MFVVAVFALAAAGASAGVPERTMEVTGRWLQVPVVNAGKPCKVNVWDGGSNLFSFCVNAGTNAPDWFFPVHVEKLLGKRLRFAFVPGAGDGLHVPFERFRFTDGPEYGADLYDEACRPQFHFSPIVGWNNDPNGLSYFQGKWHLFYQGAPCARMHRKNFWGHAVSDDLVHWRELDPAVWPDNDGYIASGSAVVDEFGTAGFGMGAHVLVYTRMPWWGGKDQTFTQDLAYSADGKTYVKYAGNPVLPEVTTENRDPKVFWHEPTRRWVMFLYVEQDRQHTFNIYNSEDLKHWELASTLRGSMVSEDRRTGRVLYECPDCRELAVEGEPSRKHWVVWGGSGAYLIGDFDGRVFTVREGPVRPSWKDMGYYAPQTFSGNPSGRAIWMPWTRMTTRADMKFNQCMGLPCELGLKRTKNGLRMTFRPVRELSALRDGAALPLPEFKDELAEVVVNARAGGSGELSLQLRGARLSWDAATEKLRFAFGTKKREVAWPIEGGELALRIFLDRQGVEVYSADGVNLLPVPEFLPDPADRKMSATSSGEVRIESAAAYRLKSIWSASRREF